MRKEIAVVVFANKKDFFCTKLCVASIRYYYPDVEIFLVKDHLNGNFNTATLRKAFNVKLIELEKKYFGWSAAKIFFLLNEKLPKRRYLCLDSDIIFVGNILHRLNEQPGDFVLHPEIYQQPFSDMVKKIFLDPEKVVSHYKEYSYPGFFFNAGQTVVTPGLLGREIFLPAFNPDRYPYYRDGSTFPLVDQSILNIVIPIKMQQQAVSVSTVPYMLWSVDFFKEPANNDMKNFEDGAPTPYLVHYAGDTRTHRIEEMKGYPLLQFFRSFYYGRLGKFSILRDKLQDVLAEKKKWVRFFYLKNRILIELGNRLKN